MRQIICFVASVVLATSAFAGEFKKVTDISGLISGWTRGIQLYVQGDVGLDDSALSAIADDLKKAPHWTVVLWADATTQQYKNPDNRTFNGFDAVEYGVGQSMMSKGDFASQKDEQTQLANGAILLISLNPRKLSYYSSPLQDRYGLNTKTVWAGQYSSYATKPLQQGRNIREAINAPIKALEEKLASVRQGERAQLAKQESNSSSAVAAAEQAVSAAKTKAAAFQKQMPGAQGDLARPNFAHLESGVALAKQAISDKRWAEAKNLASQVQSAVDDLIRAYDGHKAAGETIAALEGRIAAVANNTFANAADVAIAKESSVTAKIAWQSADSAYVEKVAALKRAVDTAESSAATAQADAERAVRSAAQARAAVRAVKICVLLVLFASVVSFLAVARRRRNVAANEVFVLFGKIQGGMSAKADALIKLDDRRRLLLGSSRKELFYTGQTLADAEEALSILGHLFILQASARTVLDHVEKVLSPTSIIRYNFSAKPFNEARALLETEPVRFDPTSGLAFIVGDKERRPEEVLWADLKSFKPFALSMDELQQQFGDRAKRATELLTALETAISECDSFDKELEKRVLALDYSKTAAEGTTLRIPPSVAAKLIPALDAANGVASEEVVSDPSAAYAKLKEHELWVVQAEALVGDIRAAVNSGLPQLQQAISRFGELNLPTDSYAKTERKLLADADKAVLKLAEGPVESQELNFAANIQQLTERAEEAVKLEERRVESVAKSQELATLVATTRAELSKRLGVAVEKILVEPKANPDTVLAEAATLFEVARNEIAALKSDVATKLLDEIDVKLSGVERIVAEAKAAVAAYEGRLKEVTKTAKQLGERRDDVGLVLDGLKAEFAPSVLLLGAGDNAHPNANGTVEDNLEEVKSASAERDEELAKAQAFFAEGSVFQAMHALGLVEAQHVFIAARLKEVEEKRNRVDVASSANDKLIAELEQVIEKLSETCEETVVSEATRNQLDLASKQFEAAIKEDRNSKVDPFKVAELLGEAKALIEQVKSGIEADRRLFKQASKTVAGGEKLVTEIATAIERAQIKSNQLRVANDELGKLRQELAKLQKRLDKAHADWSALEVEAQAYADRLRTVLASVRSDQEAAAKAQKQLAAAANTIDSAKRWSGSYGVTLSSHRGGATLRDAEVAFNSGDYARALEISVRAASLAQSAIDAAEAEVARAHRAEEQRQAAEAAARRQEEERQEAARHAAYESSRSSNDWHTSDSGASTVSVDVPDSGASTVDW